MHPCKIIYWWVVSVCGYTHADKPRKLPGRLPYLIWKCTEIYYLKKCQKIIIAVFFSNSVSNITCLTHTYKLPGCHIWYECVGFQNDEVTMRYQWDKSFTTNHLVARFVNSTRVLSQLSVLTMIHCLASVLSSFNVWILVSIPSS